MSYDMYDTRSIVCCVKIIGAGGVQCRLSLSYLTCRSTWWLVTRAELIFKKSSNLYAQLDLGMC